MHKKIPDSPKHHCRECKYSYDFHEKDYKGDFFMCRCRLSKYTKLLDSYCCNKFEISSGKA